MNKKGIGIGSASIMLVFAVLCLTILAIISYSSAVANRAMVQVEANLVQKYYQADQLAEYIFAELLTADFIPEMINDIEIMSGWDWELEAEILSFACEISDKKELYVLLAVHDQAMDIVTWRMRDIGGWEESDEPLNLFDDDFFNLWMGD
jgi:hypothetical protein